MAATLAVISARASDVPTALVVLEKTMATARRMMTRMARAVSISMRVKARIDERLSCIFKVQPYLESDGCLIDIDKRAGLGAVGGRGNPDLVVDIGDDGGAGDRCSGGADDDAEDRAGLAADEVFAGS